MSDELTGRARLRGLKDKQEDNIKTQTGETGSIHLTWLGRTRVFMSRQLTFGFRDADSFLDHLNNNEQFKEHCTIEIVSRSGLNETRLEALLPC
jgi:hypothetical protein